MISRSIAPGWGGMCEYIPNEGFPGTVTDGRHLVQDNLTSVCNLLHAEGKKCGPYISFYSSVRASFFFFHFVFALKVLTG